MAKIYGTQNGEIVRFVKDEFEENMAGALPDYDSMLEFDADTNASVIQALDTDWNSHTFLAGILYRSGQPVEIASPGQLYNDRQNVKELWGKLNTEIDWLGIEIPRWATLTANQKQQWLAANFDRVMRENLYVLRFIRWLVRGWMKLGGL